MSYKIISQEQKEDILYTKVEYTFSDGSTGEFNIPHFRPETEADVLAGIENRELSEQAKLDAIEQVTEVAKEIEKKVEKKELDGEKVEA